MNVMLDSGAYSAWKKGTSIDLDRYAEYVKRNRHLFKVVVNLDVIGDAKQSYNNWLWLRKRGVDAMPVFHLGTDEKYLEKYLRKTDYIGLGAVAQLSTTQRNYGLSRVWDNWLVGKDRKPTHKVHGMGLTSFEIIKRFPWYSVDSTAGSLTAAFGKVLLPYTKNNESEWDFLNLYVCVISDQTDYSSESKQSQKFLTLGPDLQEWYKNLFEENDFEMGDVQGVAPYLRSNIDNPNKAYGKMAFTKEEMGIKDTDKWERRTIANDFGVRRRWNYLMFSKLRAELPAWDRPHYFGNPYDLKRFDPGENSTELYMVGTQEFLKDIIYMDLDLSFLCSYYLVTKKFAKNLETILKG